MAYSQKRKQWGHWNATEYGLEIKYDPECASYDIPWSQLKTLQQRLHFLWHMTEKNWMSERDLSNMCSAFRDLYGDKFEAMHVIDWQSIPANFNHDQHIFLKFDSLKYFMRDNNLTKIHGHDMSEYIK